ncbi:ATP-binding protein [Pleomorphomonas sp. PLEO]|uniref:ATP-binding protein n=1 Tax=Pleomorphomonas sp. PLEO TaxID=3239306 RepID=UPI00351E7F52
MTETPAPETTERRGRVAASLDRLDDVIRRVRVFVGRNSPLILRRAWIGTGHAINRSLPKGLLGRSLLIVVVPMLILLGVLTGVFMDRHWILVTQRLSDAVAGSIAGLAAISDNTDLTDAQRADLVASAGQAMGLSAEIMPTSEIGRLRRSSTDIVHSMLAEGIQKRSRMPFSIRDTSDGNRVEVRMVVHAGVLKVDFARSLAYAANWHFFLVWMVGTALFLVLVSLIFLRNQIKPIERLAAAAEAFGRGRPVEGFAPSGAREVRQAAHAFIGMRRRLERQIEQRTTMLAGVGHDLKTILTRFRLGLALLPEGEETADLRSDVAEMEAMLEAYVDFARGDADEAPQPLDVEATIADCLRQTADPAGRTVNFTFTGDGALALRPTAFRRLIANLVGNAARYGRSAVWVTGERREGWLSVTIEDDGPGIPGDEMEAVFRPFYRLDAARNQDVPGTGLGLAIARDVARSHGGDIELGTSPHGGLKATIRLPA